MRVLLQIIVLLVLCSSASFARDNKREGNNETTLTDTIEIKAKVPFIPNVTIYTPKTSIYDDAVDIVRYDGYVLYDIENNPVLEVKSAINKPVKLKLDAGSYIVKLAGQETPVYSIKVKDNQYNEFVIE